MLLVAAYEILVIFASSQSAAESAAYVISIQLNYVAYSFSYGIQVAVVALVGY